jgi:hypothetical protein
MLKFIKALFGFNDRPVKLPPCKPGKEHLFARVDFEQRRCLHCEEFYDVLVAKGKSRAFAVRTAT